MKKSRLQEIIKEEYTKLLSEVKIDNYDIGMSYMGNGLTIYDRSREEHGDYKKLAHIGQGGKISWYEKNPTPKLKRFIEKQAKEEAK
jgi:hypothetical protein